MYHHHHHHHLYAGYLYAILETGLTLSMRSELLLAHGKLGQLLLLTVYVVTS